MSAASVVAMPRATVVRPSPLIALVTPITI
jgi:hypothetical protein